MGGVDREVWVPGPDGPVLDRVEAIEVDEPDSLSVDQVVDVAAVQAAAREALATTTLATSTKAAIVAAVTAAIETAMGVTG